jgi:hypothetical protein
MPRRLCQDFRSDSELAVSNVDPFERQSGGDFDDPTPVSDGDIDEPSPSQLRNEMTKKPSDDSFDEQSEMAEPENSELGEMVDGDARDRMVLSKYRDSDQNLRSFPTNVICKFTATLEDMRKQKLMESLANLLNLMTCAHHPVAACRNSRRCARLYNCLQRLWMILNLKLIL